jgi:hypothetical protein
VLPHFLPGDGFYALYGVDFQFFDLALIVVGNSFKAAADVCVKR